MKFVMSIGLLAATILLVAAGIVQTSPGGIAGVEAGGSALPAFGRAAQTPPEAVASLLSEVRLRNWHAAYGQLANAGQVDEASVQREWEGGHGSLRVFSGLERWEVQALHQAGDAAQVRATLHWSTAIGPQDEVRDLDVVHRGDAWQVVWPAPHFASVPAQVVPVTYLRWDLVNATDEGEWGQASADAPRVRILSMNAVPYQGGLVVMGEVVNEDTIPAFVNIEATLVGTNGNTIDDERSFDKILHVLLPKQVSPYRIDFPAVQLGAVKSVRMNASATLVPASADPVIGIMDQKLEKDGERAVLRGQLLNQDGRTVNIPHVIASFYDTNGRVIWVADQYVERALLPQAPEAFAVAIPAAVAQQVHSYHVVANQYSSLGTS